MVGRQVGRYVCVCNHANLYVTVSMYACMYFYMHVVIRHVSMYGCKY